MKRFRRSAPAPSSCRPGLRRGCRGPFGLPGPGQQAVEVVGLDLARDQALQHVGEVGERVDTVQFCRVDEGGQDGPALAAGRRTREQGVLPAETGSGVNPPPLTRIL